MPSVVLGEAHLKYNGVSYYRGHAEEVELLSIGEKRTPITKQNFLEVKDRLPVDNFRNVKSTVVEIDRQKVSAGDFATKVSAIIPVSGVPIPVKLTADEASKKFKDDELKLVKISMEAADVVRAINDSPAKRNKLIDWGNDARVAHQVFLVIEAKTARAFDNNASVEVSVGVKGVLELTVGGSKSSKEAITVTMEEGACFAYLLAKIDWDAKQKKNINKATDVDTDQWGIN